MIRLSIVKRPLSMNVDMNVNMTVSAALLPVVGTSQWRLSFRVIAACRGHTSYSIA